MLISAQAALLTVALLAPLLSTSLAAQAVKEGQPTRWVVYPGGTGPGRGKHIVLVSGDEEYRSEEALPQLAKILSQRHGFRCTQLFSQKRDTAEIDPDERGYIPGLGALADADMLVLFTRFRRLADEDMQHIRDFVAAGKPLLGIRTATHAFAYEKDSKSVHAAWTWNNADGSGGFGRQILGETWISHHGRHGSESTRGVIPEPMRSHPILRGVKDVWGPTDVYGIRSLPADAQVLLEGAVLDGMTSDSQPVADERNNPRTPICWLRQRQLENGQVQRIVASTIGAAIDLQSEHLRRLFINACYWGMGLEEAIGAASDARLVGEYTPTMFGFGGFQSGVFPRDHALASEPQSKKTAPAAD